MVRSLVVEDSLKTFKDCQSPPPAYFYCSRNPAEPGRSDPGTILASIARQLSCPGPGPILQPTVAEYRKQENEASGPESLRLSESRGLILELAESYPVVTIIIDALDECDEKTRNDLLEEMETILRRSSSLIKIFVSSRDDQDIVFKLQQYPNLELSSDRNSDDIAMFVKYETNHLVERGHLLRFSENKEELQQKIIKQVTDGADGM